MTRHAPGWFSSGASAATNAGWSSPTESVHAAHGKCSRSDAQLFRSYSADGSQTSCRRAHACAQLCARDEEVEAVEMEEEASLAGFTEEQIGDVVRAMKEMRNNRKQDTAVVHGVEISYKLRKTVEGSGPPGDMAAVDPRDRKIVKSLPKLEEKLRKAVRK